MTSICKAGLHVQALVVLLFQVYTIIISPHIDNIAGAADIGPDHNYVGLQMDILHRSDVHEECAKRGAAAVEYGVDHGCKRLERDEVRVQSLLGILVRGAATAARQQLAEVVPALKLSGSGDYFVRLALGGGYHNYMSLDTGSELSWIQCKPCGGKSCIPQVDPSLFDPSASATLRNVSCKSPVCHRLLTTGLVGSCYAGTSNCAYKVDYADGSSTAGSLVMETITGLNNNSKQAVEVLLGCGHDNTGIFGGAAGIVGLARGPLALASQLSADRNHRPTFSYCLPPRRLTSTLIGPSVARAAATGSLVLGSAAISPAALLGLRYTPLLLHPDPALRTFYYVSLTGITVGSSLLPIAPSAFQIDSRTGGGGVILDSEVAISRLPPAAYAALRTAFVREAAPHLGHPSPVDSGSFLDTCFDTTHIQLRPQRPHDQPLPIPRVVLHFAGGLDLELPPSNVLVWLDDWASTADGSPSSTRKLCLAFAPAPDAMSFSIIGNVQQQGFRILYDAAGARLGVAPHQCT